MRERLSQLGARWRWWRRSTALRHAVSSLPPKPKVIQFVLLAMSQATRVTEKGQATIPKDIREKYDLEPGDEVIWMDTDEGIVVKKRTRTSGRGMLVPDDLSEEERENVAEELQERVRDRRDRNYQEA